MSPRSLFVLAPAALLVAALAAFGLPDARSQINAAPTLIPIGATASGSASTVWFHEPSTRQAVACTTLVQGTGVSGIQCVSTRLP